MNRLNLAFFLFCIAVATAAFAQPDKSVLLDSYAALINGKVITVGDVLATMPAFHEKLARQYSGRELERKLLEKFNEIRDALVESELILLDFETQGGTLPSRALEDHVQSIIHDKFENDRTAFLEALAQQRLTYTEWHQQIKEQLIVQIMRQKEVSAKILITPLDLQRAYDEHKASFTTPERVQLHFYTLPTEPTPAEPRWIERLRADPATPIPAIVIQKNDGTLIETAHLQPAIQAAIAPLQPGQLSAPILIEKSRYMFRLLAREAARTRPADEVTPELQKQLRSAEYERLSHIWLTALRAKYYVQIFDHSLFE